MYCLLDSNWLVGGLVGFGCVVEAVLLGIHANASFAERKATMALLAFLGEKQVEVESPPGILGDYGAYLRCKYWFSRSPALMPFSAMYFRK